MSLFGNFSDPPPVEPPMRTPDSVETRTYTNPVYRSYFADPFVWQHKGEYYAVGTGPLEASGQVTRAGRSVLIAARTHARISPVALR